MIINPFNDKRFSVSLLLLFWPIAIFLLTCWILINYATFDSDNSYTKLKLDLSEKNLSPDKITEHTILGFRNLFNFSYIDSMAAASISNNPFYYPIPPPPPPPVKEPDPPPPPPTTENHAFQYVGYLTTTQGDEIAFLSLDGAIASKSLGDNVVLDLWLEKITPDGLVLQTRTNSKAALTLNIPYNTETKADIPLKN